MLLLLVIVSWEHLYIVLKYGFGSKEVFYGAAFHSNEWITSTLLMKFVEDLCVSYSRNIILHGFNVRQLLNDSTLYIVPMVNPDGVNLVTGNLNFNSREYTYAKNISKKYPNIPFPNGWKANINGVEFKTLQPFLLFR